MKPLKTQNIALGSIYLGENYRQKFDKIALDDLAQSISEKGVLQPIIVRIVKGKNGYELVSGGRRLKASLLVHANNKDLMLTIPSVVYEDLSDSDAMEIQITENLQRSNVHPMEEAKAFKNLIDVKGYGIEEMAKRFGKTRTYILQQLKLNDLITELQDAFFEDRCLLKEVISIAQFDEQIQSKIWVEHLKRQKGTIRIEAYMLNKYLGNLRTVAFSLSDASFKKLPACEGCIHNSATAVLFAEDAKEARCLNISCFNKKTQDHFKNELEKAKSDPLIEFVSEGRSEGNVSDKLKKEGFKIHSQWDINILDKPEPPIMSEYEEGLTDNDYNSREDMLKAYDDAEKDFQKELAAYNKKVESGNYFKFFFISGTWAGHYGYMTKAKSNNAIDASGKVKKDVKITQADIKSEIDRIKDREKRAKELDEEKTTPKIFELLEKETPLFTDAAGAKLQDCELRALILILMDHGGYMMDEPEEAIGWDQTNPEMLIDFLKAKSTAELQVIINILTRLVVLAKFTPGNHARPSSNDNAASFIEITDHYNPEGVAQILNEQYEVAEKRSVRTKARLENLEAQLKPKKEAGEDTTAKKSSKTKTVKTAVMVFILSLFFLSSCEPAGTINKLSPPGADIEVYEYYVTAGRSVYVAKFKDDSLLTTTWEEQEYKNHSVKYATVTVK